MYTILLLTALFLFSTCTTSAQPTIQWQRCLGGDSLDGSASVCPTADGGYVVSGRTTSVNGDLAFSNAGPRTWVVKLDAAGNTAWQAVYPNIVPRQIHQTTDGGYIITGYAGTTRLDGNGGVSWSIPVAGNTIQQTSDDGYILCDGSSAITKLDAGGNIAWTRTVIPAAGIVAIQHNSIRQTTDGGYILASIQNDEPSQERAFLTKTNDTGGVVWSTAVNACVTGCGLYYAEQTSDGGYIATGGSTVKLNATGSAVWNKFYLKGVVIHQAPGGGYTLLGSSSFPYDLFLRQLSAAGDTLGHQAFGGSATEFPYDMRPTSDRGAIVAGHTLSNDGDVSGNHGAGDIWIVKFSGPPRAGTVSTAASGPLLVHPTLTRGEVRIQAGPAGRIQAAHCTDLAGREVHLRFERSATEWKVNFDGQPAGLYLLQIRTANGRATTHKVVYQP